MKFYFALIIVIILSSISPLSAQQSSEQNRNHNALSVDLYQAAFNYYELGYENAPFKRFAFGASLGYSPSLRWATGVSAYGCALTVRYYPWGGMKGFFAALSPRAYWLYTEARDSGVYNTRTHAVISVIDLNCGYRWFPRNFFGDNFFIEPSVSYMLSVISGTFETVNKDAFSMKNKYPVEEMVSDGIMIALKCGISF